MSVSGRIFEIFPINGEHARRTTHPKSRMIVLRDAKNIVAREALGCAVIANLSFPQHEESPAPRTEPHATIYILMDRPNLFLPQPLQPWFGHYPHVTAAINQDRAHALVREPILGAKSSKAAVPKMA